MRTTLNIADDVLYAVQERARDESRSTGEVLSDLARVALIASRQTRKVAEGSGTFYGFEPLPHRGPTVSNELIDSLREEEPD